MSFSYYSASTLKIWFHFVSCEAQTGAGVWCSAQANLTKAVPRWGWEVIVDATPWELESLLVERLAGASHDCLSASGNFACLLSINHTIGQSDGKQGSLCESAK